MTESQPEQLSVVPAPGDEEGWMVDETLESFPTQEQAVEQAREALEDAGGGEVAVYGGDGQLREREVVEPPPD